MEVIQLLRDLATRLEEVKAGDVKEVKLLKGWLEQGGFGTLTAPVDAYLDAKLKVPEKVPALLTRYYNYIKGPVKVTVDASKTYDKKIVLLGDRHIRNRDRCSTDAKATTIDIVDFLRDAILTADDTVDLFVETKYLRPFSSERQGRGDNFLGDVDREFDACLKIDKSRCMYNNARVHYADIRFAIDESFSEMHYATDAVDRAGAYDLDAKLKHLEYVLTAIHPTLSKRLADEKAIRVWFDESLDRPRIEKQIRNVPDKGIRDALNKFFADEIARYAAPYTFTPLTYSALLDAVKRKDKATISKAYKLLFEISIAYMDVYLLARMFRTFRQVKNKPSGPPKNILVYVGNYHAENYRRFLKTLNFDRQFEAAETRVIQCVDISTLALPLFPNIKL
ncbi:Hypothetical protein POVN_LOCUS116 [uncultured virus]|nr:Hypothetical protein POVN_LOCUS116 [uncultured virus]